MILLLHPWWRGLTFDGRPYTRHGPITRVMPSSRHQRILLERMHASYRWENQPARQLSIRDLDKNEILRTLDEAVRRARLDDPGTRDLEELLTGFGVIADGKLLNAAVVLFGKSERTMPNYPQCAIRMARFRGVDKTEFLDNRQKSKCIRATPTRPTFLPDPSRGWAYSDKRL